MKSIGAMLKQLHNIREELTPWQQGFISSCWSRSEQGTVTSLLTEKQVDIIPEIYSKHFGD